VNTEAVATTVGAENGSAPSSVQSEHGRDGRATQAWARIERFLVYAGDWLNPILVKETRQAIKSFQFTVTFVLLLIGCWLVTIGGVATIGPGIKYAAEGGRLMLWYYAILAFPLAVVVPYAAFRSLAAEREDNTYDLLSITTLRPWQIVSGKLGSAIVQMGVYFSAITPCLAFTYLLRGIDLPTIAVLLACLFFWSLGLSMVGILLATSTKRRFAHVFVSVAFVGALLWLFAWAIVEASIPMIQMSYFYLGSSQFWERLALIATWYTTFFALAYFAAAGMIAFSSENRATPLRICMLVQTAAFVGWIAYYWIEGNYHLAIVTKGAIIAIIYWYVMGAMLTAEKPGMSQRVRRHLPQSFLGRMFLSWLNPGPASGYMFGTANATSLALICWEAVNYSNTPSRGGPGAWVSSDEMMYLLPLGLAYLVGYLGLGLLVIRLLRRIAVVTMLACVLIHALLLLAGFGIPYAIKSMSLELRNADYSFLQITDPIYSLHHVASGASLADVRKLLLIVPSVAVCVLLANMPGVSRELRVVREAAPKRVLEDEAELHPPPEALPTNPWDEPT
jgi:hypothetical protein